MTILLPDDSSSTKISEAHCLCVYNVCMYACIVYSIFACAFRCIILCTQFPDASLHELFVDAQLHTWAVKGEFIDYHCITCHDFYEA